MNRDDIIPFKIGLLATGDEICQGDILNTNSKEIAQLLMNANMEPYLHAVTPDVIGEIEAAMRFLLNSHQALIITGGLGPTSDDLTRFALAKVAAKELIFNTVTWDAICTRLKNFGYTVPPDSNRQQALFPDGAVIIPNQNGTAAGCYIKLNEQFIFMLPGPPFECLPMVNEVVLPTLKAAGFQQISYRKKWLLFGVSEGKIAEELDELTKPYDCITGYRLWYPYIEFKVHAHILADFEKVTALVEKTIQPYLFNDGQQAASARLQLKLTTLSTRLQIKDHATFGALQFALMTPQNFAHICFTDNTDPTQVNISIEGLKELWEQQYDAKQTELKINFPNQEVALTIPFRGKRVVQYAVELICHHINEFIDAANLS
jgi:nicotinamide-nucleotide amidase